MRNVVVDERRWAVLDQGRGPPVLLVHGYPLDHTMWQGQIDELSHHYRVIAPDLPGFGGSQAAAGVMRMADFADGLARLLDVLGIAEPVVLGGLSMGGYIAWQFWRRHRRRLAALIVCDTRAVADSPDVAQGRLATAERVATAGVDLLPDAMLPKLFAPATSAQRPELVEATRRVMLNASPVGVAAALRGMAQRPDVAALLPEIDVPTLVVCGQYDAISAVAEMRTIAANIHGAQFVEIPAAGHMAPLENAGAVNRALRQFLAGVHPAK